MQNAAFLIQAIENLPRNGYEDGIKNNMLEYQDRNDVYQVKILLIVYPYGLNERTKFMIKNGLIGKLFPRFARYGECFIDTRTQSRVNNHGHLSDMEISITF